jgi:site-specific DNA recombinase
MGNCAIYCRVSSDEQAEKGTIEAQISYAKRYLELHGPEHNIDMNDGFEFYIDEGVSGTIPLVDRPAGVRLLTDAKKRKFKILFVYRLDRLARSVKHVLDTYDLLESKEIALKSMTEAFDTGTPTGKFFMTLLASIAALERDTILERTQLGKDRNAKDGKWVSGAPPFGYRIGDDGKLIIFEPEAETVRLIFKLYTEGMTMVELAKYLNAKGVITPAMSKRTKNQSIGKWHAGHISIILKTRTYTGIYHYLKRSKRNRETIEITVPTVIEPELFDDIQKKIFANSDNARGKRGRLYLLRGVIFCGHCGRAMIGNSGGTNKSYYRCSGTMDQGQGKRCSSKQIKASLIEDAVWSDVLEIVKHPEQFKEYIDKSISKNKEAIAPIVEELSQVEESISTKLKARGRILALITRGVISDREAEDELRTLATEIKLLNERKEFLFGQQEKSKIAENDSISSQIVFDWIKDNFPSLQDEAKARIIRGLVKRIEVTTIAEGNIKKGNRAVMSYKLGRSIELRISGDAEIR